jgi:hypothetical protein
LQINKGVLLVEETTEEQLRTAWTPLIQRVLYDYTGSAAEEITQEVIDKIMPLTREIIKAMELEQYGME